VNSASFRVEVTEQDARRFAELSGDWNPLHTDASYASQTAYRRPILHGAFSAGLFSRLAGMHIPGRDCLLHNLRLRFIHPILPPASLVVTGSLAGEGAGLGRVEVTIVDATTGSRYVEGSYEFSRHEVQAQTERGGAVAESPTADTDAPILITGATGGLGRAVLKRLGGRAIGISRSEQPGMLHVPHLEQIRDDVTLPRVGGIVHCAWPAPGNERLTDLPNIESAVEFNLAAPLRQAIALAQFLRERGTEGSMLVLVGSTASRPGRHNYRMPLYTLSKALVPELTRVLATELAHVNRRCSALTFDVIDGGMNQRMSASARIAHEDRVPAGMLPSLDEAAAQVQWVLDNASFLISGGNIEVTGAAIP
jgi:3-hydroxybutyryl-CoA dehydratase